jgi:hypothetical protein
MACIRLVAKALERRTSEGASNVSAGGVSISWEKEMDPDVKMTLDSFKKIHV